MCVSMDVLKKYDKLYSDALCIYNPYKAMPYRISRSIPIYDKQAYDLHPKHNFVYDKLFIVQSQFIKGGVLMDLKDKQDIKYPIFIKPRWGHKTSTSKDCYKIKSYDDLKSHFDKKDMMWSEFIDATEGMTDFILVNGTIVFQMTYVYSEKQYGFADVWKYISSDNQPPPEIVEWVNKYMTDYTGPVNVQYRSNKIIEVGLRFARSGMYLESTENKTLIDAINYLGEHKTWTCRETITIEPFYSFKCWCPIPILCLLPQHVIDIGMKIGGCMPFYEYYFEPTGKNGLIFFQFLHKNFETGMKIKELLERLMLLVNCVFIGACIYIILCKIINIECKFAWFVAIGIFLGSLLNSPELVYTQLSHQQQFI